MDNDLQGLIIEGVNVSVGLSMVRGRMKSYKKVLAAFHVDSIQKISELEKCFENKDIRLYTTYIHGFKTVLANIGAQELSQAAGQLEAAGNIGDWGYIERHNAEYLLGFKKTLKAIEGALADLNPQIGAAGADFAKLHDVLMELKGAMATLDMYVMKRAAESLADFSGLEGFGQGVKAILHNKTIGEYELADAAIDKLIEEIKQR